MQPLPQKKSNQLISEINRLTANQRHNPFVLQGFEKEAKALIKADPVGGYILMGVIAGLKMNIEEMRRYYNNAIHLDPQEISSYSNYSASLQAFGFYKEAFEYAKQLYESDPANLIFMEQAMIALLNRGRIFQSRELIKKWNHLSHAVHFSFVFAEKAAEIMTHCHIGDDEAEQFQNIVCGFLQEKKIYVNQRIHNIIGDEGAERILCGYEIDVQSEGLPVLEYDLQSELSSSLSSKLTDIFWTEFIVEGTEPASFLLSDEEIKMKIREYEKKYGMSSEEFMQHKKDGTAPDEFETMRWMILSEHILLTQKQMIS